VRAAAAEAMRETEAAAAEEGRRLIEAVGALEWGHAEEV